MLGNWSVVTQPRARLRRLLLANDPQHFVKRRLLQPFSLEGRRAGQQLIEQHAQRIDVAAGVDVELVELGLLGTHVLHRPEHLAELREHRPFGQLLRRGLGHAEVDHFRHGMVVVLSHEHVGGLDIAMDDALLVGMLHRLADLQRTVPAARGAAGVFRRSTS